MSQVVTASRGRAARIVSRRPSSDSRRSSAIRSFAAATRTYPSSRAGPPRRSASAPRTAVASPTSPSASYVAPIRRGSASTWMSRPESSSAYWPVVSAPSSVPTASTTSAPARSSRTAGSSSAVPTASWSSSGKAPLPMYVVATGAPSRSATARSSSQAAERSTPPPAQTTGVIALARRYAASSSVASSGSGSVSGATSSSPGRTSVSPASTSTGISRKTGPLGGVSARRQASASSSGISPALSARAAHFTTGAKEAFWSGSSCRKPRPAPIRSRGIWLAIATTGTCALAASMSAASEMSAPGPVERRSGAGRPLVRA